MYSKRVWWALGTAGFILYGSTTLAAPPMPEVARKAACATCHRVDRKLIGPAFAWVAYKYKDDKVQGKKAIIHQIINGGKGKWTRYTGGIVMPSYGQTTTEAQRNELADFILSLTPVAPPQ